MTVSESWQPKTSVGSSSQNNEARLEEPILWSQYKFCFRFWRDIWTCCIRSFEEYRCSVISDIKKIFSWNKTHFPKEGRRSQSRLAEQLGPNSAGFAELKFRCAEGWSPLHHSNPGWSPLRALSNWHSVTPVENISIMIRCVTNDCGRYRDKCGRYARFR